MPVYTLAPTPTSPSYTLVSNPGGYIFDDVNVIFNDLVVLFDGGNQSYTNVPTPTSPSYTLAPSPS